MYCAPQTIVKVIREKKQVQLASAWTCRCPIQFTCCVGCIPGSDSLLTSY